jgi:hypothetical protein
VSSGSSRPRSGAATSFSRTSSLGRRADLPGRPPPATTAALSGRAAMAVEMIGVADFRRRQAEARRAGRYLGLGFGCYVRARGSARTKAPTFASSRAAGSRRHRRPHRARHYVRADRGRDRCSPADVSVVTGDTTKFNWGAGTYAARRPRYRDPSRRDGSAREGAAPGREPA